MAWRFWLTITNVDRKIASRLTIMVSRPNGYRSKTSAAPASPTFSRIQTPNHTECRYTKFSDPAKPVIPAAPRSWVRLRDLTSQFSFFTLCCSLGTSQPSSLPSARSIAWHAAHSSVIGIVWQARPAGPALHVDGEDRAGGRAVAILRVALDQPGDAVARLAVRRIQHPAGTVGAHPPHRPPVVLVVVDEP